MRAKLLEKNREMDEFSNRGHTFVSVSRQFPSVFVEKHTQQQQNAGTETQKHVIFLWFCVPEYYEM